MKDYPASKKFNRREFITVCSLGAAAVAAYTILPGCTKSLTSSLSIDEFIKLSSVLTGFKESELDKTLAAAYLKSVNEFPPSKSSLNSLYKSLALGDGEKPGKDFTETSVFKNNEEKILADALITYWYTGIYKTSEGFKVASYENQLAWKSTGYLIPNAQCRGTFGFWQSKPTLS